MPTISRTLNTEDCAGGISHPPAQNIKNILKKCLQLPPYSGIISMVSIMVFSEWVFDPLFFVKLFGNSGSDESERQMSKITDKVYELAKPVVEEAGCSLWDVEYIREAGSWYLRVFIDKEGGVSINDCETISRTLGPILDEADPIPDSYIFEVGSAGAERELKRPGDFRQFMGSEVEVRLYQPLKGSKSFIGKLADYEDGTVTVTVGNEDMSFNKAQIALVKLHVSI